MLVVQALLPDRVQGHLQWKCVCDCGSISVVRAMCLTQGKTKSCGCLRVTRKANLGNKRPCRECGGRERDKSRGCKNCRRIRDRFRQSNRRAAILQATPPWADMDKIKEIYATCPDGFQVDHIVALKAKTREGYRASGLHWEGNLRHVKAKENQSKWCWLGDDT